MQLTYEYTATLVYMNGETNKEIPQNNIKTIVINKDFDRLTMPTITMTLEVDRNLADEIIKNKKTATMMFKMNKVQTSNVENAIEENYFYDEFTYLIEDDVDKTKAFRYNDPDKNDTETSEADKYRPIRLGLISKTCSDLARKPNNFTAYDSNMQDIVTKLLNIQKPLLIEPFDYKDNITQLIIPPKESLTKVLEYLNNAKVFYSTGYRFFMDLDVMYLVSKSGKFIAKQNEKTGIVNINVKTLDKSNSLLRGIELADDNSSYNLVIEASDSNLDDSDLTDKEINSITAVIDGSKQKQESFLKQHKGFGGILGTYTNIMTTIDNISKLASTVRSTVKNIHQATYDIRARLTEMKEVATSYESTTKALITNAEATLASLPEEALNALTESGKNQLQSIIDNAKTASKNYESAIKSAPIDMDNLTKNYTRQIYNIESTKGLVDGIKPTLLADNMSALKSTSNNFEKDKTNTESAYNSSLVNLSNEYSSYSNSLNNITAILSETPSSFTYTDSSGQEQTIDLSSITQYLEEISVANSDAKSRLNTLIQDKSTMKDSIDLNKNVSNVVKATIEKASDIPKDFKTKILEGGNTALTNYNNIKDKAIKNYNDLSANLTTDYNSIMDSFNAIKDSAALSIDSLGDLSSIGSDGESMINIALETTEILNDLSKRKIIRIPNDNINILKNIKHALELKRIKVKIHKQELDNSIFAINKKYIITFEGANNKNQGEYLLESMIEAYTNSGTQFQCNTIMNFAKLPGSKTTSTSSNKTSASSSTISVGGITIDPESVILH